MPGTKISALTTLSALVDASVLPVVDSSTNYKITGSVLATYTTSKIPTASTSVLGLVKVDGTSITINGSGVISGASTYTLPATNTTTLGGVIVPVVATSGLTNSSGTIGLATATTTQLGGVIIPAVGTSGITNTSGTIGLATATTTQLGGVKVDNSTITITSGVIAVSSALTSATQFKGNWDASTNTPTLSNVLPAGVASGWQYIVAVGATRDIGNGSTVWSVGDLVIYDGAKWVRIPSGNNVVSFNTRQGAITLTSSDVLTTALASQTANTFLAAPSGSAGVSSFRTIVAADIPSLTSAQLATIISDETGTGVVVFGTSPAITTSITTASTSFDLLNTTATTVNFAGAATTLSIGAATGTASINNVTLTLGNATAINVNGVSPTISSTSTGTLTLFNTNLLTINAFGASTATTFGATTGTHTIRNASVTLANATALNVNGVSPTIASTSTGTLTLFNTNLLTVNAFNAATTVTLANSATSLGIGNTATASQVVNMFTASTGGPSTYNFATGATVSGSTKSISIGTAGASGSTTNINIGSAVSGATSTLTVSGSLADAVLTSTAKSVGYLGLPQSATATTATLAIGDAGKHIYITTTAQTITIPANASVAYPIGTTLTFISGPSATTATIAIATDTLRLAGGTSTGNRTLAANGMATAVKVAATTWYINGTGLT